MRIQFLPDGSLFVLIITNKVVISKQKFRQREIDSLTKVYNHGQKSLGQSECNFNSMRFTSSVAKSSAVFLKIHVPFPLPTQYNVERSKEWCLDGFNTVWGVGGGGRDVKCQQLAETVRTTVPRLLSMIVVLTAPVTPLRAFSVYN